MTKQLLKIEVSNSKRCLDIARTRNFILNMSKIIVTFTFEQRTWKEIGVFY